MPQSDESLQEKLGPRASLSGLCLLTPERAQRGYRLTAFLTSMRSCGQRERFINDEEKCMQEFGLSEQEKSMIRARAFTQMIDYGACTVAIGKANGAFRTTLLERGAQGMGLKAEQFIRQRKAANEGFPWQF